jgi:hypothetical protein
MGHQSGCLSAALLLDLRAKPHLFREVSDGSLIIKFAAGPRMAASDHVREPIFWSILVVGIFSRTGKVQSPHLVATRHLFSSADVTLKMAFAQHHGFGPFVEVGYISD